MWHDASYHDTYSHDNLTYLPPEDWLQSGYVSSSSATPCTFSDSYSQSHSSSDDSPIWLHDSKNLPLKSSLAPVDPQQSPLTGGHRNLNERVRDEMPSVIGIDNSFAIDPEFSFLHGLCVPPGSANDFIALQEDEDSPREEQHPFSSVESSTDYSTDPDSDSASASGSSTSSKCSNHSLTRFSILPDIGSNVKKAKRPLSKLNKLEKIDESEQERLTCKLQNLNKNHQNARVDDAPAVLQQWENNHSVLPAINQAPKSSLRRCANSEGSLRQRLGSELPTIWEATSPKPTPPPINSIPEPPQVDFFNVHACGV